MTILVRVGVNSGHDLVPRDLTLKFKYLSVEGMVALAAQVAYLDTVWNDFGTRADVIMGRLSVSHSITLDLTLKVK